MGVFSLLLATVLGLAAFQGDRPQPPRPAARGNDSTAEILGHSAHRLYRIDLSSGQPQAHQIGTFGAEVTDIAQTEDGRVFGVSFSSLLSIDLQTGRARLIGRLGVTNVNGLAASGRRLVASSTDGALYNIDPSSGRATRVGSFGGGMVSSGDLAFSPAGVLYMTSPVGQQATVDRLVRVDPSSGHATVVGTTGHGRIYGLAFVGQDLFGMTEQGALLRLDTSTGAATLLGRVQVAFWGGS